MKSLLTLTALFELITGLALVAVPSEIVALLVGTPLNEPSGILVGRIGGAALISLAIACWLSKKEERSSILMIKVLVFYNIAAALILGYAGGVDHLSGIGLWPAVLTHASLLVWCIVSLRKRSS